MAVSAPGSPGSEGCPSVRPQEPCSAPVGSHLWVLPWSQSPVWSSSFPLALYFPQRFCPFQRTLPSQAVPTAGQLQFGHVCLRPCFRLNLLSGPLGRRLLELSSNTTSPPNGQTQGHKQIGPSGPNPSLPAPIHTPSSRGKQGAWGPSQPPSSGCFNSEGCSSLCSQKPSRCEIRADGSDQK